ncbi:MAG TPA: lipopolysaccharide biosynthesis protein [Chthoniobacteraceae bacterium]|jgi:PST family polysaccharide transporter|nr:lipopolysaccharide biosynthesis protein [Chthoniobacteraceae bacterium]
MDTRENRDTGGEDVRKRASRGIGWSGIQQIANNGMAFLTYGLLARLLPPGDFGLLAFASVFTAFLQLFIDQGIADAVVQRTETRAGHFSAAFWFNMAVSGALSAVLCLVSGPIASITHQPGLAGILRGLAPLLVLSALGGIHASILKRRLEFKLLAIQNLVCTMAGGLAAVISAFSGLGVWSLVIQQLTYSSLAAVMLWWAEPWRPDLSFSRQDLKDLAPFAMHITSSAFLDFFNRRSDDFLIGCFLGPAVLGYYSLAYRLLLTFTRLINSPFNVVAFSAFSRLQSDAGELRRFFNQLTHLTGAVAFPVFLGLAAIAPEFLTAMFGQRWAMAAPVLRILCFVGILHCVAFLHGALLRAVGRAGWQMWFTLGGALTNVIGFYCFVHWGVLYVAGWYVASAYLWLAADLGMIRRVLGHSTLSYLGRFTGPVLKGLGVAGAVLLLHAAIPASAPALWRFAAEAAAAVTVFACTNPSLVFNPLGTLREIAAK